MITETKGFVATCSICEKRFTFISFSILEDRNYLEQVIENNGWWSHDDAQFCPSCHKQDDNGNLVEIKES